MIAGLDLAPLDEDHSPEPDDPTSTQAAPEADSRSTAESTGPREQASSCMSALELDVTEEDLDFLKSL